MKSLFWRIFFSFWITITVFSAIMGGFSDHIVRSDRPGIRAENLKVELGRQADYLQQQFNLLDKKQIIRQLNHMHAPFNRLIFVKDHEGKELLGRDRHLHRVLSKNTRQVPVELQTLDKNKNIYQIVIAPVSKRHLLLSRSQRGTFARIVFATLLSALVSYLLARSLSTPLMSLRKTSHKLADGDLTARNESLVLKRKDEIGQLGKDIDAMASRLQKFDQSRSRLLIDVSHELRSPLARLQVALELAKNKHNADNSAELKHIEIESERLRDLIDQALTLLRDTTTTIPLDRKQVNLGSVLKQLVDTINYAAQAEGGQGIQFHADHSIICNIDEELIRRAVENILVNALKFTHAEKGVSMRVESVAKRITIQIRDFGPGVPESSLGKLFDAFYRVDEARDRDRGGYGLGLAIVAAAIQRHDGKVTAKNHPQGGLVIEIILPVID